MNTYWFSVDVFFLYFRVGVVSVLSMCGRLGMAAVGLTRAAVTDMPTVSTRCRSAVLRSMEHDRGTSKNARRPSPQRTAAARTTANERSYVLVKHNRLIWNHFYFPRRCVSCLSLCLSECPLKQKNASFSSLDKIGRFFMWWYIIRVSSIRWSSTFDLAATSPKFLLNWVYQ